MKKAYKLTPEDCWRKQGQIREIEYKYKNTVTGEIDASPRIAKRHKKLTEEVNSMPLPPCQLFMNNADIYNLWLNKNTSEPVTAKELYNIVSAMMRHMQ